MTTGYTQSVEEAKITTLKDFVLLCSRAFGARITERDSKLTTDWKPYKADTSYHEKSLKAAKAKLEEVQRTKGWAILTRKYNENALASWKKAQAENVKTTARLQAMLEQVEGWEPPSEDHKGLKKFMVEQLTSSIDHVYDSPKPAKLTASAFKAATLKSARWEVDYHTKGMAEEIQRTNERNLWMERLLRSI